MIWKLVAFVRREVQVARSYRLRYVMQFFTTALPLVGFYFMSRVFNGQEVGAVGRYGGNYMTFMLVGIAVTLYASIALRSVTGVLAGAQANGSLEVLLLTRTSFPVMILGWTLYPFIRATLGITLYVLGGLFLIGVSLSDANLVPAFVTLLLIMIVMGSIGLISASFLLVFKQGDPFSGLFLLAGTLLAGTVYPIQVLPPWLITISRVFPQTRALEAARLTVLKGYSLGDVSEELGVLLIYALTLVPLSTAIFRIALRRAKKEGSLAQY